MQINNIYQGDCLIKLKEVEDKSIDLIYLDPPFFTGKAQIQKTRDNSKEYLFDDKWEDLDQYLNFLKERIIECKRTLKDTGSIFLHCDKNASHYLRVLLDEVFGSENFVNEIIWTYKRWSNAKKGLLNAHQNIFFYSKTNKYQFFTQFTDYSPTTNIDQILQARERNEHNKTVYKKDESGKIVTGKEKLGVPLSDVWDIPYLNPKAEERVGYPTQKPVILLERIIKLVTEEGDLVLDPFCGSGTTLIAASINKRQYIGIDALKEAVELSKKRLEEFKVTKSHRLEKGLDSYLNKEDYVRQILIQLDAVIVERNKGIDGFLKKHIDGKPVAIYVQRKNQSLSDAISLLRKATYSKGVGKKILIRTNDVAVLFDEDITDKDDLMIIESLDFQVFEKFTRPLV